MEHLQPSSEQQRLVRLIRLARAVFELARQTPTSDKQQLELVRHVSLSLGSVVDEHEHDLHPDLGHNISEYVLFKLEDDGADPTGWTKGYEKDTDDMLDEIEQRYGIDNDSDARNQNSKKHRDQHIPPPHAK